MKKIFLIGILSLCFSNFAFAQEPIVRDSVIQMQGMNPTQIYDGLKKWFVVSCVDARDIIQIDDPANGSIVGKFFFPFEIKNMTYAAGTGFVSVVVDIKIRDGRFKIKMSDFNHTSTHPSFSEWWSMGFVREEVPEEWKKGMKWKQKREVYERLLPAIEQYVQQKFVSLSDYLKTYTPSEDEEW